MWSTVWLVMTLVLALAWLGSQWYVAGLPTTRTGFYRTFLTVEQIKGIAISLVVTFIALLMFNSFFPEVSSAYAARGGPEALLIVGVLFICLATFLSPTQTIRKWLVGTLATIMVLAVVFTLVPAVFVGKPSTAAELQLQQEQQEAKQAREQAQRQYAAVPAVMQACPGLKVRYRFEATQPVKAFNPDANCAPDLWHEGKCIYVQQTLSPKAIKHCPGEAFPVDVEYAWSAEKEPFDGYYRLSPPRYTKLISIR